VDHSLSHKNLEIYLLLR